MRLLLGGFEPFGGETDNPSMQVVRRLQDDPPPGVSVRATVLPVSYRRAWPALLDRIGQDSPDLLLLTGLAGGRSGLTVERLAINLDDARIADNAGELRSDAPVVADGPAAYFTTLPAKAMVAAVLGAGVEASVSLSAGAFLCNHVLYRACHHAATAKVTATLRCGLVHLPWLPEQAAARPGAPSMALETMVAGVRAALGRLGPERR